jgi:hypothetical protein
VRLVLRLVLRLVRLVRLVLRLVRLVRLARRLPLPRVILAVYTSHYPHLC